LEEKKQKIKKLFKELPITNRRLLQVLCKFLTKVLENEKLNLMTSSNLATVKYILT
jgi:hypothetical protein